jgi:hypothetical protein
MPGPLNPICSLLIGLVRAADPRPFTRVVFPEVIEPSACRADAIVISSTEEPEISGRIAPTDGTAACSGNVVGSRRSLGAIHPQLVGDVRPAHPRPFPSTVLPEVVEITECPDRVKASDSGDG